MRKWTILAGGAALAVGLVWAGGLAAADDKPASIKDIMTKAHKRGTGILMVVGTELRKPSPDFDALAPKTKQLADLGGQLAKNDPPKGEKESWQKLCKQYEDTAKALNDAVTAKDAASAKTAQGKLGKSCMACHQAHRGE
jgi:cytochrome c556